MSLREMAMVSLYQMGLKMRFGSTRISKKI